MSAAMPGKQEAGRVVVSATVLSSIFRQLTSSGTRARVMLPPAGSNCLLSFGEVAIEVADHRIGVKIGAILKLYALA